MEYSRVVLFSFLVAGMVLQCLANSESCGVYEHRNVGEKCQMTCNACRDCGPCICKTGYIRSALGGDCITEHSCHQLHLTWLHEAKHENKKDKFFNCST